MNVSSKTVFTVVSDEMVDVQWKQTTVEFWIIRGCLSWIFFNCGNTGL